MHSGFPFDSLSSPLPDTGAHDGNDALGGDYRILLHTLPDVVSRVELDGRISFISPNVEAHSGWTVETFVGKRPFEAPLWDGESEYERLLQNVFESGVEADFEYEHRGCFYRARLLPERDERGQVASVLSITEDITAARQLQTEAARARQLFDGLSDATPGLITLYDLPEKRIVFVGGGVSNTLGYSVAQFQAIQDRGLREIVHPDDLAHVAAQLLAFGTSDGDIRECEYRVRHADGSWRWLHARYVLFSRGDDGSALQVLGMAIDITARHEAEAALRESEERLRLTVDAVELGTWDWFVNDSHIVWNEWHYRLFGLEPDASPRNYEDFEQCVHPEDRAMIHERLAVALRDNAGFAAEFRVLWPDGSQRWMSGQGNVSEHDAAGQPVRMIGVMFDVTTRKQAEAALQHAHDALEVRVEERTAQLQSTVSQLNDEAEQRLAAQAAHRHLLSRLVNMQEEERRRLSRELHDQFGQTLTAMLMTIDAGATRSNGNASGETAHPQDRLRAMVVDLTDQIHQLAWELRPASLDNVGLLAALRQLVSEWDGLKVDFVTRGFGEARLPAPLEIAFYRVIQEALTNIARHAKATSASVVLEKSETHARAIVEDNGRGFDLEKAGEERLGILGMRERMDAVGGSLEVETSPGGGTAVFARAPLVSPSLSPGYE